MSNQTDDKGIVNVPSPYPVPETMDRLEAVVKARGAVVFIRIDQRREAQKVGLELRPTELLLFGNPKAGTVLMKTVPSVAIDLPLKALAWEDGNGQVWLSYNSPEYLQKRHRISDELIQNIAVVEKLVQMALSSEPEG